MPVRNRNRVITGGPQGPDASLQILLPTVGEAQDYQKDLNAVKEDPEASLGVTINFFKRHILGWNWVDDNNDPLPQPGAGGNFLELLTIEEVQWLSECFMGTSNRPGPKLETK